MADAQLDRRRVQVTLALLGAGALGAVLLLATSPKTETRRSEPPAPLVRVVAVAPGPLELPVRTHGNVTPRSESDLVPEISGPVIWISPSLATGGFFEAGELLLRIDPADARLALEKARAAFARAASQRALAAKELERLRGLAAQNIASPAQLDDASNADRVAEAALREARAQVQSAERDLARTEIHAPYTGRVRSESVDVGQFVTRGVAIAHLFAVDYAEIRLPVPDADLAHLELPAYYRGEQGVRGPEVTLHAELAGVRRTWTGYVVRTEGEIDPRSRMLHLVARVDDPYARESSDRVPLPLNLFVDAEIAGRRVESAVVLPRAALRDAAHVLVVDGEDRIHHREVGVLRASQDEVVIGSGLAAGERVCISPLDTVVDGMRVRVAGETPAAGADAPAGPEPTPVPEPAGADPS
jgi:RND family efflux transporter MFP subunit